MSVTDPSTPTASQFTPEVRGILRAEIAVAGGNEVFFFGSFDDEGHLATVETVARGNDREVPVFIERAGVHRVLIHNHPGGDLTPSPADLSVASEAGARGLGFFIIDNAAERVYRVVEPFDGPASALLEDAEIAAIFSSGGLLARTIPRFEDRPGQREMALEVAAAFNRGGVVACEAGTGVGKSFAYLVPAILWAVRNQGRVVVSTATIALQEQLVGKDLPQLQRTLDVDFQFALIKGRANYLCRRKTQEVSQNREYFGESLEERNWIDEILNIAETSQEGSLSDLQRLPPGEMWSHFESTSHQSLKARCPFYRSCFYYEARRRAIAAHVIVVNHHLFFSDLRVRRELGSVDSDLVIPGYRRVVFDEAHRLEEVAAQHFGAQVTRLGLSSTLGRLWAPPGRKGEKWERGRFPYLLGTLSRQRCQRTSEYLRMELIPRLKEARDRLPALWEEVRDRIEESRPVELTASAESQRELVRVGDGTASVGWERFREPLLRLREEVEDLQSRIRRGWSLLGDEPFTPEDQFEGSLVEFRSAFSSVAHILSHLDAFLAADADDALISWVELTSGQRSNVVLRVAPVRVSEVLVDSLYRPTDTVVMTSATLSVGEKWDFLADRLGWHGTEKGRFSGRAFSSPFDFPKQAVLAVPIDLPPPTSGEFGRHLGGIVLGAARAARGRTFALFTSHRMLKDTANLTRDALSAAGFPVLVQGTAPRSELLRRFQETGNAVLFGNQSFWEGVDVPGAALSCVVIARLPFRVPTHPLERGRVEDLERRGENAFFGLTLPQAVLSLKQGVGRLIRTNDDRGVIVIADSRVKTKSYGSAFLKSLPDFARWEGSWNELLPRIQQFFGTSIEPTAAPVQNEARQRNPEFEP